MAEATNENDEVTTSSPGPRPSACRQQCRPAVPLEQATAWRTPMRSAHMRSNRVTIGPSESCPERSTCVDQRALALPDDRPGERDPLARGAHAVEAGALPRTAAARRTP